MKDSAKGRRSEADKLRSALQLTNKCRYRFRDCPARTKDYSFVSRAGSNLTHSHFL
jgi:hypothetical protein